MGLNGSYQRIAAFAVVRPSEVPSSGAAHAYIPSEDDCRRAKRRLQMLGFDTRQVSRLCVRFLGSARQFSRRFGVQLQRDPHTGCLRPTSDTVTSPAECPELESIVFPQAVDWFALPCRAAPRFGYHHLCLPHDVVRHLNVGPVHAAGCRGKGVRVAMLDSGFGWSEHPYFQRRKYRLRKSNFPRAMADSNGHGTAMLANLLAVAPEVTPFGISIAGSLGDKQRAIAYARDKLRVDVIVGCWGTASDTDGNFQKVDPDVDLLERQIRLCHQQGIIVVFAAGNLGPGNVGRMCSTASLPETISVGGVYVDHHGVPYASDFASSFASTRFPHARVPDVCGLTGLSPRGMYIAAPVPPLSDKDRNYVGSGGAPDDGWAVCSGTSAACAQVSGIVALILARHPQLRELPGNLKFAEVRRRLRRATAVQNGISANRETPPEAVGAGLANADHACR